MQSGGFLEKTGHDRRSTHVHLGDIGAMTAQKHRPPLTQGRRDLVAELARSNQTDSLEQRHAVGEHARRVVQNLQRLANLAERNARRRMHVGYPTDIGPRSVDPGVDPELGIRVALALPLLAVQVEHQQPVGVGQRRAGAGGEHKRVGAGHASADVPERGHQARGMHDPIRQRHVAT